LKHPLSGMRTNFKNASAAPICNDLGDSKAAENGKYQKDAKQRL
jgi:hypothetical protein